MNTKAFNRATAFFRNMQLNDANDSRWGEFADAMDEVISTYVPIVRCKDCKHGDPCNDGEIYCEKDIGTIKTAVHEPDWFCADGERKEGR